MKTYLALGLAALFNQCFATATDHGSSFNIANGPDHGGSGGTSLGKTTIANAADFGGSGGSFDTGNSLGADGTTKLIDHDLSPGIAAGSSHGSASA